MKIWKVTYTILANYGRPPAPRTITGYVVAMDSLASVEATIRPTLAHYEALQPISAAECLGDVECGPLALGWPKIVSQQSDECVAQPKARFTPDEAPTTIRLFPDGSWHPVD